MIDYAQVEWASNGILFNGASGTVRHSILRNNNIGLQVQSTNLVGVNVVLPVGNEITLNTYGVWVTGGGTAVSANHPTVSVRNGAIHGNVNGSIYQQSFNTGHGLVYDFTGNWWGSSSPQTIASSITDYSDSATLPIVNFAGSSTKRSYQS